jgi:hypothetical protein
MDKKPKIYFVYFQVKVNFQQRLTSSESMKVNDVVGTWEDASDMAFFSLMLEQWTNAGGDDGVVVAREVGLFLVDRCWALAGLLEKEFEGLGVF